MSEKNPYPKNWFQMYDEERKKCEILERCLAETEKLVEKWRKRACGSEDIYDIVHNPALRSCSNELEAVLRGGG